MAIFAWSLLAFACIATLVHLASTASVIIRVLLGRRSGRRSCTEAVSLIRPIHGLTAIECETLASSFEVRHAKEVIFCCESVHDPAVAFVQGLIERHDDRNAVLLVGNNLATANPKLNNIAKGWRAAQHNWIVIADSNLHMPSDSVPLLMAGVLPDTGLVCAPPVGGSPRGFWAEVEVAFLNTYQARWQYAADSAGFGFAQGKVMLWQRDLLDRAGGISVLASELAEDAAATKFVRAAGLKVRLAEPQFVQPIGARTPQQVLARQMRWAQLRRLSFPLLFLPEILTGCLLPTASAIASAWLLGGSPIAVGAAMFAVWLGAEFALARTARWHFGWLSPAALLMRDLLIPAVWIKGWTAGGYEWQGQRVIVGGRNTHDWQTIKAWIARVAR